MGNQGSGGSEELVTEGDRGTYHPAQRCVASTGERVRDGKDSFAFSKVAVAAIKGTDWDMDQPWRASYAGSDALYGQQRLARQRLGTHGAIYVLRA